jgi:hypothetical protein
MRFGRRVWLLLLWLAVICCGRTTGVAAEPAAGVARQEVDAIERALASARDYLVARQTADGAWRSDSYATFRDGDCLTPLVLCALARSSGGDELQTAQHRGVKFLADLSSRLTPSVGAEARPLNYPIYTAASAVIALESLGEKTLAQPWRSYLLARQLTEQLGWTTDDPEYGGWSYAADPTRKSASGEPAPSLGQPNLSATYWALRALRAGDELSEEVAHKAARFIERRQNFAADASGSEARFDDGGFHFISDDPVRNKAGLIGYDRQGRPRFRSYFSATADGLAGLLLAGHDRESARCRAAWSWLDQREWNPLTGDDFPPDRTAQQRSAFYYACRSAGDLLKHAGPSDRTRRAKTLARQLIARQAGDGSWSNDAVELREDEPLVATSLACETLAACRTALTLTENCECDGDE